MNRPTPPADKGVGTDSKQYPGNSGTKLKLHSRSHISDFSLNLMNYQSHNLTGEFLDMMYSNTFFSLDKASY